MADGARKDAALAAAGFALLFVALAARSAAPGMPSPAGLAVTALFLAVPVLAARRLDADLLGVALRPIGPSLLWGAAAAVATIAPLAFLYPRLSGAAWFPLPPYAPRLDAEALARESLVQLLLVAVPEEFFCRGFLQGALARARTRARTVIGARVGWEWPAASAAFALLHLPAAGPAGLLTLFPGLAFGWLYARTGRIWAGALLHAALNVAVAALSGSAG